MKKELLFSLSLTAVLAAGSSFAGDWMDTTHLPPEPPPPELVPAAPAAAEASAPAPVAATPEVPAAPIRAPDDEIKTVTPVVSTQNTAKATAIVLRAAALRSRPTSGGTGDIVAAESRVRLESHVVNGEGSWWFVTATGVGGGWLLESELGDPQR